MNLRQKIKMAKKELKKLDSFPTSKSKQNKRRQELTDLINSKRHLNSYTDDEKILNGKLTYMELSCGMTKLSFVKNPNGKPLSVRQQMLFNNHATQALLKYVPVVYEKYKNNNELPSDFHSIYTLYVSTDSKRAKRLFCKLSIYQFKDGQSLYIKQEGKWIKIIDKD
ncbi:hypothetical protein ACQKNX_22875 [Lysinibacillus sp. NPDC093712]|uniref:hypothetical protein n=1 Tax=Lysinibacillus sp. NPDC093712 TaxID=3390579 RepID=UPI003D026528